MFLLSILKPVMKKGRVICLLMLFFSCKGREEIRIVSVYLIFKKILKYWTHLVNLKVIVGVEKREGPTTENRGGGKGGGTKCEGGGGTREIFLEKYSAVKSPRGEGENKFRAPTCVQIQYAESASEASQRALSCHMYEEGKIDYYNHIDNSILAQGLSWTSATSSVFIPSI
jgi:hypothetical protein